MLFVNKPENLTAEQLAPMQQATDKLVLYSCRLKFRDGHIADVSLCATQFGSVIYGEAHFYAIRNGIVTDSKIATSPYPYIIQDWKFEVETTDANGEPVVNLYTAIVKPFGDE
jgi:hypothetical protein